MRGNAERAGRAQEAAGVAQGRGLGGARGHPALAPQWRFLGESADVRWEARGQKGSGGRGKRRPWGIGAAQAQWRCVAHTRARLTPPIHALLPHLGAMLRRRARRGERGGKVWEAQATKGGLGLFVSLRRRACTRLRLCFTVKRQVYDTDTSAIDRNVGARCERYRVWVPRESRTRTNVAAGGRSPSKKFGELPKLFFASQSAKPEATQRRALSIGDDAAETMHAPRASLFLR